MLHSLCHRCYGQKQKLRSVCFAIQHRNLLNWWNQQGMDPGNNPWEKKYNATLSVFTVLHQVYKWTTIVTLEHKKSECNSTSWDYNWRPEGLETQRRCTWRVKQCIILWTDFCQGSLLTVGAGTFYLTNIW